MFKLACLGAVSAPPPPSEDCLSTSSPGGLERDILSPFKLDKDLAGGADCLTGDFGTDAASVETLENEMPEFFSSFDVFGVPLPFLGSFPALLSVGADLVIEMLELVGILTLEAGAGVEGDDDMDIESPDSLLSLAEADDGIEEALF